MMDKTNNGSKNSLQQTVLKALKATIKAVIFYAVYFFLWQFLNPISQFVPGFQLMVETFVIVYIVLMVVGELASGTIYQHFFNAAKALFVIAYLMSSLKTGILGLTLGNTSLIIDVRLFLTIAMLLGLLGLAKSVMQAINYMSEKAEVPTI
jgi:hypothetical protein